MADGQHTRPERAAEFHLARRQLAHIRQMGGCAVCVHAVSGWGRSTCSQASKAFPGCLETPGLQFEIDHDKLKQGNPSCM